MRKKIFIIHGFGLKDGTGWEAGGDLDTVSSNVFYTVWAENEIAKQKGEPAIRGVDYDYDFVNYSEGLSHLVVHSGCDVYIPDFPIDALSPRLELLYLPDPDVAQRINEFNKKLFDLKIWIAQNSAHIGDYFKKIFNSAYKQKTKVIEHPDVFSLKASICILTIIRSCAELSLIMKKGGFTSIETYLKSIAENITGNQLKEAKNYIVELMGGYLKEEQMDMLDDEEAILKIEESNDKDFSAKGRINYTDDILIIASESMAYAVRNYIASKSLAFNKQNSEKLAATSLEIAATMSALFKNISRASLEFLSSDATASVKEVASLAEAVKNASENIAEMANEIKSTPVPPEGIKQKLTVILMEQSSGKTISGIKITFQKILGNGFFEDDKGNKITTPAITVETDKDGVAFIHYLKTTSNEQFQISATYDDVKYLMLPEEIVSAADSSFVEEILEEEDEDSQIDRAMGVSLKILEKELRELARNDVNIASLTDHHPYTQVVYELLSRLHDEGVIKEFNIQASARGDELPIEKQVCGANIVYGPRIAGKEWENEGLKELNNLARLQDLHIQKIPLAISLSKLIGSKHSKVDMVQKLSKITDKKSLDEIMTTTGWADIVADYEGRLSNVLPRSEETAALIKLKKRIHGIKKYIDELFKKLGKKDKNEIEILSCLSPFCDPRKNEPQINVASAIEHIINKKRKKADYFFYCYGANILTQRKMDNNDERINLSTLSQFIGTKADGGHSGAATCKPMSNPNFPKKRLSAVRDNNFLEYLYYLGDKMANYTGFNLDTIEILTFDDVSQQVMKNLEKTENLMAEVTIKSGWKRKKILIVKLPKFESITKDDIPSFFQIAGYLTNNYRFDYLFAIQGALGKIIMANINDIYSEIDLEKIAQAVGWKYDLGDRRFTIASPRRNKKIPKEMRFFKEDQFYQVCGFISRLIETTISSDEEKWKIHAILAPRLLKISKEIDEVSSKLKRSMYEANLISSDRKKSVSILTVAEPYLDGIKSPTLTQSIGLLRRFVYLELHKYLLYVKYSSVYLINLGDENRSLNCLKAAESNDTNNNIFNSEIFCSVDKKALKMPVGFEKMTKSNSLEYIKLLIEKLSKPSGYSVNKVEKKLS